MESAQAEDGSVEMKLKEEAGVPTQGGQGLQGSGAASSSSTVDSSNAAAEESKVAQDVTET